jgi:hypothetical protein
MGMKKSTSPSKGVYLMKRDIKLPGVMRIFKGIQGRVIGSA